MTETTETTDICVHGLRRYMVGDTWFHQLDADHGAPCQVGDSENCAHAHFTIETDPVFKATCLDCGEVISQDAVAEAMPHAAGVGGINAAAEPDMEAVEAAEAELVDDEDDGEPSGAPA